MKYDKPKEFIVKKYFSAKLIHFHRPPYGGRLHAVFPSLPYVLLQLGSSRLRSTTPRPATCPCCRRASVAPLYASGCLLRFSSPLHTVTPWQARKRIIQSLNWDKSEAEAEVAAAIAGADEVPVRRTAEPRDAAPTAATEHAVRAGRWSNRVNCLVAIFFFIPIPAPLPYIPVHVIKSPGIGCITSNF